MLRKVVFGPLKEPVLHAGDESVPAAMETAHPVAWPVGWHEIAGLTPLMVMIVAIGVLPRPLLEQMRPALDRIEGKLQAERAEEKRLAVATEARAKANAARPQPSAGGARPSMPAAKKSSGKTRYDAKKGGGGGKTTPKKRQEGANPGAGQAGQKEAAAPARSKTSLEANGRARSDTPVLAAKPAERRP
jgi:hypothetical protein